MDEDFDATNVELILVDVKKTNNGNRDNKIRIESYYELFGNHFGVINGSILNHDEILNKYVGRIDKKEYEQVVNKQFSNRLYQYYSMVNMLINIYMGEAPSSPLLTFREIGTKDMHVMFCHNQFLHVWAEINDKWEPRGVYDPFTGESVEKKAKVKQGKIEMMLKGSLKRCNLIDFEYDETHVKHVVVFWKIAIFNQIDNKGEPEMGLPMSWRVNGVEGEPYVSMNGTSDNWVPNRIWNSDWTRDRGFVSRMVVHECQVETIIKAFTETTEKGGVDEIAHYEPCCDDGEHKKCTGDGFNQVLVWQKRDEPYGVAVVRGNSIVYLACVQEGPMDNARYDTIAVVQHLVHCAVGVSRVERVVANMGYYLLAACYIPDKPMGAEWKEKRLPKNAEDTMTFYKSNVQGVEKYVKRVF